MDNTGYRTDDRRDYDDRQTNYEGGNYRPRRNHNSEDGGSRRPHNQEGYRPRSNYSGQRRNYSEDGGQRRPYGSEGQRRPYGSEGQHRQYNGYGKPRSSAPRRYNNEDGFEPRRQYGEGYNRPARPYNEGDGYGRQNGRRYNSENQGYSEDRQRENRRPYNPNGAHRSYNSEGSSYSSEGRRPNNGYGKPRGAGRGGYNNGPRRGYSAEEPQGTYGRPRNDKFAGKKGGLRPRKNSGPKPESGIDRMISRKPVVDEKRYSDNDMVKIPIKAEVRLNKFIADSGICSRREADNFIVAGVVTVNGKIVTELGSKVNKFEDDVRFNGERLKGEAKVYIVMNKPKGYVTTTNDPHAEKTVMDLLKGCTARVTPVGRLDKNTTGVLMFTNDGEIAEKLTHPAYNKKKIYEVTLTSDLSQEDFDKIVSGIALSDGVVAADELEYVSDENHKKLGVEIHSGKNRIVRRIFESLGYTVKSLDRVYFAGLTKKGIKRGAWRYLSEAEVNILKMGAYN
ncbi:MAG: pseudouridine synthase [Bacteroidales bacterium]|nr:pseudouridine synthase [Bacteroidales bacterium]